MPITTIVPPETYFEWVAILDKLKDKEDDVAVLFAMQNGTLEWQSGVAERFSKKLIDVINYRMNVASDKFQKEMSHCHGEERIIIQALIGLRKEMRFLASAINLSVIPEKERQQYYRLVIEQANKMQDSLEESARSERSGKLISIVRNNRINSF